MGEADASKWKPHTAATKSDTDTKTAAEQQGRVSVCICVQKPHQERDSRP